MRTLLLGLVVTCLAGCPKPGPEVSDPKQPDAGVKRPPPIRAEPGEIRFATCDARPCMFHGGSGGYHECLNVQDGKCFQYGRSCTPAGACMFDSARYRKCEQLAAGSCRRYGATCEPAGACVFVTAERRYRRCDEMADGVCRRTGAPCEPAAAAPANPPNG